MNFPYKLKELRKQKNLTQEELAKEIFVSRTLISKYENGAAYPTRETIEKLALFFGVKISDLVDEDDTATLALRQLDTIHKLNLVLQIVIILITLSAAILSFLPIVQGSYYDYANYQYAPGTSPDRVPFTISPLAITLIRNGNPIVLIGMISCFANSALAGFSLRFRDNVWLRFISYALFVVNIFLIFFSIVFCAGYASMYMGGM